jgi:hypothetical protein
MKKPSGSAAAKQAGVGEARVPAFGRRPVHGYRDFVRPHRDEGGFHRVICDLVSLLVEVRPHFDERVVFR